MVLKTEQSGRLAHTGKEKGAKPFELINLSNEDLYRHEQVRDHS